MMNDYSGLANKLAWYAESDNITVYAEPMRQAADAIRTLENEIAKQNRIREILHKEHHDFMASCKRCDDALKEMFKT